MFKKVLIANRGEIAVRVIRACRDLGISPVAVYSEADRAALHVRMADEAYPVGPAPSSESYLAIGKILDAARRCRAEAIHPGYGFLSENPAFAEACADTGIPMVGPSAAAIRLMGNKTSARSALQSRGVPLIPGTARALESTSEAVHEARRIGYPLMIKAAAGGGGKGMRLVRDEARLAEDLAAASSEAERAFGDAAVYLEKYIASPRHIEVQVIADRHGHAIHLGERECSLQRRHQKLLEESPSPIVDPELRGRMGEAALNVVRAAGYENAGTVEFLVDGDRGFYFLEMNTRLQVEHPVTELVTGTDLVREQLRIAAGETLSWRQDEVRAAGWAIECRIYAEDPDHHFYPSPGTIRHLIEPQGPGIRVDSCAYEGCEVPVYYDPLIAKLIAYGADRTQAVERMRRALREYRIQGVRTNLEFFSQLLCDPDFLAGRLSTEFVEEFQARRKHSARALRTPPPAFAVAAALSFRDTVSRARLKESSVPSEPWKNAGRRAAMRASPPVRTGRSR